MSGYRPVYLDYLASTPVDPRVADRMAGCLTLDGTFGNPASRSHVYGWRAEEVVEDARRVVAELVNADPREIVWTSGATESDNLAIKGIARHEQGRGRHLVTSCIEHKAVLDSCQQLEIEGFEVTRLRPDAQGRIDVRSLEAAIRPDTVLVSLMHVNNELGTINDIAALGMACRARGVRFHVDAAQSLGKLPIDLGALPVDLMSFSAHKLYGPKGIGALFVRRDPQLRLEAQMHGGGHERGMRSGTLATHQIAGFGEAARIAGEEMPSEAARIAGQRDRLWTAIAGLGGIRANADPRHCIPGALNLCFEGLDGEALMSAMKDLAVSSGSACTSASIEPSYVLKGIGLSDQDAHASLRFGIGRFTDDEDIDLAIAVVGRCVRGLRDAA